MPRPNIVSGVGTTALIALVALFLIALSSWLVADLEHARRWSLKRAELGAQGRWNELDEHFQERLTSPRPLLWLYRRIFVPGLGEGDYALHRSNLGDDEGALKWINQAIRKITFNKANLPTLLRARALILTRMGKYEEAKASITQARSINSSRASLNNIEGLIELYLGNLDRALALAQEGMNLEDPKDALRLLAAGALRLQGRFQEAINALVYDPTRLSAAFGPANFKDIGYDQLGQRLILKMDQEVASIFPPGRELAMAEVFLDAGDTENLQRALDRAEGEMQSNPAIQIIYLCLQACSCGLQEDATGTEKNLAQLRDLSTKLPTRSVRFQTHYAAGRAYLSLQRTDLALSEFQTATNLAVHPVERHSTDYWLARAAKAAGDGPRAMALFQAIVQSRIASWMNADAQKHFSRHEEGGCQRPET